jgi:hypothetical protein
MKIKTTQGIARLQSRFVMKKVLNASHNYLVQLILSEFYEVKANG